MKYTRRVMRGVVLYIRSYNNCDNLQSIVATELIIWFEGSAKIYLAWNLISEKNFFNEEYDDENDKVCYFTFESKMDELDTRKYEYTRVKLECKACRYKSQTPTMFHRQDHQQLNHKFCTSVQHVFWKPNAIPIQQRFANYFSVGKAYRIVKIPNQISRMFKQFGGQQGRMKIRRQGIAGVFFIHQLRGETLHACLLPRIKSFSSISLQKFVISRVLSLKNSRDASIDEKKSREM